MEPHWSPLLLLALGALSAGNRFEAEIIGGREAAPYSRPYMASLQRAHAHLCGGVLVHPQWVLTAAHCLTSPCPCAPEVAAEAGAGAPRAGHPQCPLLRQDAVSHPDYRPAPEMQNDLALLQLDQKVQPSRTVRPLALPPGCQVVAAGARCSVAGWGVTRQGGLSNTLQELDVHVLDPWMCTNSRFWHGDLTPGMVCLAANAKHQAPCKGDSGGPLVCGKGLLAGILSFGSNACTDVFRPPVATAVGPYVSWIKKTLCHRIHRAAPDPPSVVRDSGEGQRGGSELQ